MNTLKIAQIRIVLDEVRKTEGAEAAAAVLHQVGAIDADSISPDDYPQVMALCGFQELADSAMTCHADDQDKAEDDVQDGLADIARDVYGSSKKPHGDFKTVVASAPTLKEGLDLAARAIHSRRGK